MGHRSIYVCMWPLMWWPPGSQDSYMTAENSKKELMFRTDVLMPRTDITLTTRPCYSPVGQNKSMEYQPQTRLH